MENERRRTQEDGRYYEHPREQKTEDGRRKPDLRRRLMETHAGEDRQMAENDGFGG